MTKPEKPHPNFPLFAHANGQWAKKIKGKLHYFGHWNDPDRALERYRETVEARGTEANRIPAVAKTAKTFNPPYDGFPLFVHPSGYWCKKIRGKHRYFGRYEDGWEAALAKYQVERDALFAGHEPHPNGDELTVGDLRNWFLYSKELLVEQGEIKQRTWEDYKVVCDRVIEVFGKTRPVVTLGPADFERLRAEFAKTHGPKTLSEDISRVCMMFKYAYDQELIDRPIRYGQTFKKPSKKLLRRQRNKNGPRMYTPEQLHEMLDAATVSLRAMILLGINCGFGNSDCATLPMSAVNLDTGWINFPRPKTEIERRCPLWDETAEAIRCVLTRRPQPARPEWSRLVFLTQRGNTWDTEKDRAVSKEMSKLLHKLGIKRPGLNFYALRHTFQTIGEEVSETATGFIMGHAPRSDDMSAIYRERISDDRLLAVTNHVHDWFNGILSAVS